MPTDWSTAPLPELMTHIVATHHAFCRREMVRLTRLFEAAPGGGPPGPRALAGSFQRLCAALSQHLAKEEMVLFPLIAQIVAAQRDHTPPPQPAFGSVANPIRMMVLEHDEAAAVLRQMREATSGFQAPAEAAASDCELYAALQGFDRDMQRHVELEDQYLFPRAIAAEQEAHAG